MIATNSGRSIQRLAALVMLTVFSGVLAGCGESADAPPLGQVSGKITFENKPVTEGMVNFAGDNGFGSAAVIGADGTYSMSSQHGDGIPLGKYKVNITPPPFDPGPPAADDAPVPPNPANIPAIYREFSTSGFTADVKEGDNTFDFDMKP